MSHFFTGIPESNRWSNIQQLNEGWSGDRKYVFTDQGETYLLRLSDGLLASRRKREFEWLEKFAHVPALVAKPVAFGMCNDGKCCYTIMTWLNGTDARVLLPTLSNQRQYTLGYEAGTILRQLHSLPVPKQPRSWFAYFNHKVEQKMEQFASCGMSFDGADDVIRFIQEAIRLTGDRPQSFQHGDFHCGNMIITKTGNIGVIDFDRAGYGDPWEEFNRITWCANVSPEFASGRIDGYFQKAIPDSFFPLMALYIAVNMISSVPWAMQFGEGEMTVIQEEIKKTMIAYDHFHRLVPQWYKRMS
ncbi:MAG: phosphotransferase [Sporolactobacillus sp.]